MSSRDGFLKDWKGEVVTGQENESGSEVPTQRGAHEGKPVQTAQPPKAQNGVQQEPCGVRGGAGLKTGRLVKNVCKEQKKTQIHTTSLHPATQPENSSSCSPLQGEGGIFSGELKLWVWKCGHLWKENAGASLCSE